MKNELVVLGRNGSDYSAAVLAALLTCGDVVKFGQMLTVFILGDPRLVPDARLLKGHVISRGNGTLLLRC